MNRDDPTHIDFWIKRLWNYFERDIRSGLPIYLCLDSKSIRLLAQTSAKNSDDLKSIESFHSACNRMFNTSSYSEKASVRKEAYTAIYGPHSAAICLAIQQVLVVEDMIDDQHMSYDSYFPRYRKRLGLGPSQHSNPLSKDDFEKIWSQLKREILCIDGATEKTITFREGTGRKNVTRNYPLSQALLSTRDLYSLKNYLSLQINIDSESSLLDIQRFFFKYRTFLTSRGRKVIQNEFLLRSVVDQFRRFLKSCGSEIGVNDETLKSVDKISLDMFGSFIVNTKIVGFQERYTIRYKVDFDHQYHDKDCVPFLDKYIATSSAYVFLESSNGYTSIVEDIELNKGDCFVLCYKIDSENFINSLLEEHVGPEWRSKCSTIKILEGSNYIFRLCGDITEDWQKLHISKGKILAQKIMRSLRLDLRGGLQINKLKSIFLDGYPPNQILLGAKKLDYTDAITVNGFETTIGFFLQSLNKKCGYKSFHLEHFGIVKEFIISDTNEDSEFNLIGFPKHEKGLYPIAQPFTRMTQGLCGWMSMNPVSTPPSPDNLDEVEIAWLARIEDKAWISVKKDLLDEIVGMVEVANIHSTLRIAITNKILRTKKLPAAIIKRHFVGNNL